MIELATLSPIVRQYIQENGVVELRLVDGEVIATPKPNGNTSAEQDVEIVYYEHFYRHHFDRERLQQAIGETDECGRAKNTLSLPSGLNKEQLRIWLEENIPAYLEQKVSNQRELA